MLRRLRLRPFRYMARSLRLWEPLRPRCRSSGTVCSTAGLRGSPSWPCSRRSGLASTDSCVVASPRALDRRRDSNPKLVGALTSIALGEDGRLRPHAAVRQRLRTAVALHAVAEVRGVRGRFARSEAVVLTLERVRDAWPARRADRRPRQHDFAARHGPRSRRRPTKGGTRDWARARAGAARHDVSVAQLREPWRSEPLLAQPAESDQVTKRRIAVGTSRTYRLVREVLTARSARHVSENRASGLSSAGRPSQSRGAAVRT
jgi:uncharacterized DUF497 family protein